MQICDVKSDTLDFINSTCNWYTYRMIKSTDLLRVILQKSHTAERAGFAGKHQPKVAPKDCVTAPSHSQLIDTPRSSGHRFSDNHSIGYF